MPPDSDFCTVSCEEMTLASKAEESPTVRNRCQGTAGEETEG
jgi:hypothetical protein